MKPKKQEKILLNTIKYFQSKKILSYQNIKINTPYLVDQLSAIEYVLSDKTGTITKNSLELMTLVDTNNNVYNYWIKLLDKSQYWDLEDIQYRFGCCFLLMLLQSKTLCVH